MVERLSRSIENKFWKGPDVQVATDVFLNTAARTARIPILIHPESLPPMDGLVPDNFYFLHGSVRSRWAQLGVDLEEEVGPRIAGALVASVGSKDKVTSPFFGEVVLHNRASRPIHIPKGSRIFRLYYDVKESALFGKDLIHAFTSENIKIEGEFGRDWAWAYGGEDSRGDDNIVGMHVRIDPRGRRWIPPDADNIAVTVDDSIPDYRTKIDELLVPVPHTKETILWVGQTNKITLSSVEVVLDRQTRSNINVNAKRLTRGYQINSRLIDDGRTNWPVRVEILSPTTRSAISNFVTFHFRRNLRI
jgi:hypothetical protein